MIQRTVKLYSAFLRTAFLNMMAYRLRYYTGIFTYLIFVSVYYFIWTAVYAGHAEGAKIHGFTLPEMLTYVAVGWISRSFYFSNIDDDMNEYVESGQIGIFLLRPVNFQIMMLSQAIGESLFRGAFFSLPIAIVITLVYPVIGPATAGYFGLFLLSTLLAFFIMASVNFLVGLLAFSLKSVRGIMRAKHNLIQLFSGLMLPLAFFPGWARAVLEVLPFQAIAAVPLAFYLGKVAPDQIMRAIGLQLFWVLLLFVLGQYFWQRAMRTLTIQGG